MNNKSTKPQKRRKKYSGYTNQDINNAIAMIVKEEYSVRQAANTFNIPRTTLASYLKNAKGNRKLCSMRPEEDDVLQQWMTDCCQRGFSIKRRNVEAAAEQLIKQSGEPRLHPFVDDEYYETFLKRWVSVDKIKDRKCIGVVPDWYSHIESFLLQGNYCEILNDPNRIFLCDEFKFLERMDVPENIKIALTQTNMLYTTTAAGTILQPLILYPYKGEIPEQIVKAAPKNCAIVPQQHGTVTPKIFIAYLKRVIHKYIEQSHISKPVIVYIDESQIDVTLELTTACTNLGIVLLGLTCQVPKPTINLFRSLVQGWTEEVELWNIAKAQRFSIVDCATIMQLINLKYTSQAAIIQDFHECLLFPWNRPTQRDSNSEALQDDDFELERFLEDVDENDEDEDLDCIPEEVEASQIKAISGSQKTSVVVAKNCTIKLKYQDFERLLGREMMMKCSMSYDVASPIFCSRAERALFDIYRRFRTENETVTGRVSEVIEIVEIGDD